MCGTELCFASKQNKRVRVVKIFECRRKNYSWPHKKVIKNHQQTQGGFFLRCASRSAKARDRVGDLSWVHEGQNAWPRVRTGTIFTSK